METYCFKNLKYTYPECEKPALNGVDLMIKKGDFVVVCGASGSGKSTLLRCMKEKNPEFGFVAQDPSNQIVTDKVRHELAFGMENQGIDTEKMKHAIAGTATYFGMQDWMERDTAVLSGGEKQRLNLASILVMNPDVILLDEPTSQLDPMAATTFLDMLRRLNTQMGLTVILVEQRLEEVLPICDKMLVMSEGKVVAYDTCHRVYEKICQSELSDEFLTYMPSYVRLYHQFATKGSRCPASIKECRDWFVSSNISCQVKVPVPYSDVTSSKPSIVCKNIFFRYDRKAKDILREVCYEAYPGRVYGIAGGNGSGKSTFLKILAEAAKCYHGKMSVSGRVAYLPQEPKYMFIWDRICDIINTKKAVEKFDLQELLEKHPYDVSGGQMQRVAMAYLYEKDCDIYLLDEPTKGLDPNWKKRFANWVRELARSEKTVIIVSHDVEFIADLCEYMSMCFDGEITKPMKTSDFFRGDSFFSTGIQRIVGSLYPEVVSERNLYED